MDQKAESGVIGGSGPPAGQSDFRFRLFSVIAQLLIPAPWLSYELSSGVEARSIYTIRAQTRQQQRWRHIHFLLS